MTGGRRGRPGALALSRPAAEGAVELGEGDRPGQAADVPRMQPGGRLIEHIEGIDQPRAERVHNRAEGDGCGAGLRRGLALGLLGAWTHLSVHQLVDSLYVNNIHLALAVLLGLLLYALRAPVSESPSPHRLPA